MEVFSVELLYRRHRTARDVFEAIGTDEIDEQTGFDLLRQGITGYVTPTPVVAENPAARAAADGELTIIVLPVSVSASNL